MARGGTSSHYRERRFSYRPSTTVELASDIDGLDVG